MEANPDEEIDLPIGHVHDFLDGFLGPVVVGQERQFLDEFRVDGLLDETEKRFRLWRHIDIAVPSGRIIMNGHAAFFVERVFHQRHQRPGERLQRSVVVGEVLQHGRRDGEHDSLGRKASSGQDIVD